VAFARACYMTDQQLLCPWRVPDQGLLLETVRTGFTVPSLLFSIFYLRASIPLCYKHFTYSFKILMHFFPKHFCSRPRVVTSFYFVKLRPDFGSRSLLMGLREHTHGTHHSR